METQNTESCLQVCHPLVIMRDWNDVESDIHGCLVRSDKQFWSERSNCQSLLANNHFQGLWCPLLTDILGWNSGNIGCVMISGVWFSGYFLKEKYLMDLVYEEALCYRIHWKKKLCTGESLSGNSGLLSPSSVTSAKKRILQKPSSLCVMLNINITTLK